MTPSRTAWRCANPSRRNGHANAAYCGYRAGGLKGAAAAYVSFGFPAFLLMLLFPPIWKSSRASDRDVHLHGPSRNRRGHCSERDRHLRLTSLKNTRDILLALAMAALSVSAAIQSWPSPRRSAAQLLYRPDLAPTLLLCFIRPI